MADNVVIRGRITTDRQIRARARIENTIKGSAILMLPIFPEQYTGPLTITPGPQAQRLATAELVVPADITIEPIPSNYGLISWDGAVITVS